MRSQFRHRFQMDNDLRIDADAAKLVFDTIIKKTGKSRIEGFIQEIQSNPFGALMISDVQVKLYKLFSILSILYKFIRRKCGV